MRRGGVDAAIPQSTHPDGFKSFTMESVAASIGTKPVFGQSFVQRGLSISASKELFAHPDHARHNGGFLSLTQTLRDGWDVRWQTLAMHTDNAPRRSPATIYQLALRQRDITLYTSTISDFDTADQRWHPLPGRRNLTTPKLSKS